MPVTVLVVDDSSFFRRRITEIINSDEDFKVVGQAANGREAVEKAQKLKPDLITMDYEMPFLDGISAVKEIMQFHQAVWVMFWSEYPAIRDGDEYHCHCCVTRGFGRR